MALSEELLDAETRHQVMLEGYKASETGETKESNAELLALLLLLSGRSGVDNVRDLKKKDLTLLARSFAQASNDSIDAYFAKLEKRMIALAGSEAAFEATALDKVTKKAISILETDRAYSYVKNLPMGHDGSTVAQFLAKWKRTEAEKLDNLVRKAWVDGKTLEQLQRELRGTKTITGWSKESLRRNNSNMKTLVQHVSMASKEAVWMANKQTVNGYRWISILDGKTSDICRSLSRRVYRIGMGPLPPAHWGGCRSYVIAELVSESITGKIVAAASKDPSYYAWLKTQPASFQDDVIGPTRGKLLRDGGMSAEKFSQLNLGRDFKPLTLKEMEDRNPLAFERAGIDVD